MQDIRIDDEGNQRCWKCGGKNFDEKRTFRSKATLGVGALLTHKKLKCLKCGEYNQTGNAKPFTGPMTGMRVRCGDKVLEVATAVEAADAARALVKATNQAATMTHIPTGVATTFNPDGTTTEPQVPEPTPMAAPEETAAPIASVADELKKLADLRDAGVLTDEEFADQKAILLGHGRPTSAPAVPPPSESTMPSG